ncbi:transporter, CPA2 family [Tangfeifania diversioriginum]|uniref:Transporter, CPA2 family n=1 Tax=Tangfeifania diversioriginum TaxID=1168035 RepID=A0A1M6GK29_9BACT|nr:cation:proton antiporter [Tangfeifania diversioriginum]SHJ10315.1 transporter, CPA2 family [Tangfeifania diversioriginum]
MNILLAIGLLLIIGYSLGFLADKVGLPRIIGYIATGILFSPHTFSFLEAGMVTKTEPLIDVSLAFIAFEVGGSLKWSKLKNYGSTLSRILLLESLTPFLLVLVLLGSAGFLFSELFSLSSQWVVVLALLIAPLASPTDPSATIAVMHQYNAKGDVSDTIMEVAALDDAMGVFLFSISVTVAAIVAGNSDASIGDSLFHALYKILGAIITGGILGWLTGLISKFFNIESEGQWIVLLSAFIILTFGISTLLGLDELLAAMAAGAFIANFNKQSKFLFKIIERYTEDLIFLFFFILSGLHLDITAIPAAAFLIAVFVVLRISGKYFGSRVGAAWANAPKNIRKYTAGGLIPQGGIVIGLALLISKNPDFSQISDTLLAVVMGSAIFHEIIGPLTAVRALKKAGETNAENSE